MSWRTQTMCDNCPFSDSGQGLILRRSLRRGRWTGILNSIRAGETFECHKTVQYDDEGEGVPGSGLACAGAIKWQHRHGAVSNFVRVCERIEYHARRGTIRRKMP